MLNTAVSLRQPLVERQTFNPEDPTHIDSLKTFLRTGNWGAVQFFAENPYTTVPTTVLMKHACHTLGIVIESDTERRRRLGEKELVQIKPNESPEAHAKRLQDALKLVQTIVGSQ
jgi:hypothetical protein